MERKTFILAKTKPFRHHLKLFLKDINGKQDKLEQRIITFTTEHKVGEKERVTNARLKHAEYICTDEREADALFRSTGYGKTFYLEGDEKGELKRESYKITEYDVQKTALRNLFAAENLAFDSDKSVPVLNAEYQTHIQARLGVKLTAGSASNIPHVPVDVQGSILEQAELAAKKYKDQYGEEIPAELKSDFAFLDGLSNPKFDAKAYITDKGYGAEKEEEGDALPDDGEDLRNLYFQRFKKNVPNAKKFDTAWIKQQLEGGE